MWEPDPCVSFPVTPTVEEAVTAPVKVLVVSTTSVCVSTALPVMAPPTVKVLLNSKSANASRTAAPPPAPSVKIAATLPLPIVMLAPEP